MACGINIHWHYNGNFIAMPISQSLCSDILGLFFKGGVRLAIKRNKINNKMQINTAGTHEYSF